jgi:hypothetical protein
MEEEFELEESPLSQKLVLMASLSMSRSIVVVEVIGI